MTGTSSPPRHGRALRIASPLYRVGDWLTDGYLIAHRDLPLFGHLYASLPSRDGIYQMTAGGYTRHNRPIDQAAAIVDKFLAAPLVAANIIEQAPANMLDLDNVGDVVAYEEPWYVCRADRPANFDLLVFDGAAADPVARYQNFPGQPPVDAWWLTEPGTITKAPALVGTVAGERRFLLVHGMGRGTPGGGTDG